MKKRLMFAGLLGAIIGTPLIYSAVVTSKTADYGSFYKANKFESIDTNKYFEKDSSGNIKESSRMFLRETNFRASPSRLEKIFWIAPENSTTPRKNNFGELKLIKNMKIARRPQGSTTNKIVNCENVLQNDIFTFCLFGDFTKFTTLARIKQTLQELSDNVVASDSLLRSKVIIFDFHSSVESRSIGGNEYKGSIVIDVNSNDIEDRILNKMYYVTFHELMHLETIDGEGYGIKGYLLSDVLAQVPDIPGKLKIGEAVMRAYGNATGRPDLGKIGKSLMDNPFQSASIPNVYLGNIPNYKYKTISGYFDSEITHLYTNPTETVVEDLISFSIGNHRSNQVGAQFTGLLGSIGYRISHDASLLNMSGEKRSAVNRDLMQMLFDNLGFRNDLITSSNTPLTSPLSVTLPNKTKVGFYSFLPINLKNKIKANVVYQDGSTDTLYLDLKNYKTNVYMRTSPFVDQTITYSANYNQIAIPTTKPIKTLDFEYANNSADQNTQVIKDLLNNGQGILDTNTVATRINTSFTTVPSLPGVPHA